MKDIEPLPVDSMDRILQFTRPIVHPLPKINKAKRNWTPEDTQKAKTHTQDALKRYSSQYIAFTDGSALGNPGPCGAAAIILNEDKEPHELHQPVAKRGSSYLGELKGVELALTHFLSLETQKQIHIFCDCLSAIESVASCRIQKTYQPIVDSIQSLIRAHSLNQIMINLHWTPGHIDLNENELADKKAKQAAKESTALPLNHCQLTIRDAKSIIKEALTNRWQRQWKRAQADSLMHQCYPKVNTTRYRSVMSIKAESRLLRLISGHNCLKEHMYRIKFAATPNCSCGLDVQSAEHVLINCPNHEKERLQLHLKIEHAYHIHNVPFHNRISSLKNLLAPEHNKAVNTTILKATGTFLDSLDLKI